MMTNITARVERFGKRHPRFSQAALPFSRRLVATLFASAFSGLIVLSLAGTALMYLELDLPTIPADKAWKVGTSLQIIGAAVSMIAGILIGIVVERRDRDRS